MRRAIIAVGIAFAAAAWPAAAHASQGRWGLTEQGDPRLSLTAYHGQFPSPIDRIWWTCAPAVPCTRFVGDELLPGDTAAGTVFESDLDADTERSPVWRGRVKALIPSGLEGGDRAGQTVHPTPARWSGGWGDELTTSVVLACPASTRTDCEYLSDLAGRTVGPGDRAIGDRHAGWFLYAIEYRSASDRFPLVDQVPPAPGAPVTRPPSSALVSVSPPRGPIAARPASTATVVLRRRAQTRAARVTVGHVSCRVRCTVGLTVSDGRHTLKRSLAVSGTRALSIVRAGVLRSARLKVSVSVDGRGLASGRVRLSRRA